MARQWKKQASVAYGYALTRLALNCFMYFDELVEEKQEKEDGSDGVEASGFRSRQLQADGKFRELLEAWLEGRIQLADVAAFREQIQKEMEAVVAYTDCFQTYEYALNRMERRFDETLPVSELSDEAFVRQIMGFLTATKDAATMNRRIQEVIGQLPIRFTRQKYYGMVREALSAYIGADSEALENIMYLLRTGAMVELSAEKKDAYPELQALAEPLAQIRFKELTPEAYRNAVQAVALASEKLYALSEYCQTMQEMANDLYLIVLTREAAVRDAGQEACATGIIKGLLALDGKAIPEELEEALGGLEGVQEEYYEKYQRLDPAPEYQDGEDEEAYRMRCVDLLMSTSTFVTLKENRQPKTVEVGDIDRAVDGFVALTEPVFAGLQKPVLRAVMAATLSALPVCFNSLDEIQAYVTNSLGSCSDIAEKETCKELILHLMEMEDYEVV